MKIVSDLSLTGRPIRRGQMPARPVFEFTTHSLPSGVSFTRAGSATYFDAAGVLQTAAADVPRFDHNPATGALRGLLAEPSATNSSVQSDGGNWAAAGVTVAGGVSIAPTGGQTAASFVEAATSGSHYAYVNSVLSTPATRTFSAFVKAAQRNTAYIHLGDSSMSKGVFATFDLVTGAVITPPTYRDGSYTLVGGGSAPAGSGWHRIWVSAICPAAPHVGYLATLNALGQLNYAGDGVSGYQIFGVQMEVGSSPSSYIRSLGQSTTRAADQPRITTQLGTRDVRVTTEAGVQVLTAQALTGAYWPALTGPQHIRKIEVL